MDHRGKQLNATERASREDKCRQMMEMSIGCGSGATSRPDQVKNGAVVNPVGGSEARRREQSAGSQIAGFSSAI